MSVVDVMQGMRLVAVGVTGILLVFHALAWRSRRDEPVFVVASLWSFAVLVLLVGRCIQHAATDPDLVLLGVRLFHTGLFAVVPIGMLYAYFLRRPAVSRWFAAALITGIVGVVLVWIDGLTISSRLVEIELASGDPVLAPEQTEMGWLAIPYGAAAVLYIVSLMVRGRARLDWDRPWLSWAFVALVLPPVVNDSLLFAGVVESLDILDLALAAQLIVLSAAVVGHTAELYREMEKTVAERTRELESKRVELSESVSQLCRVLEAIPDTVCMLRDGKVDYVNRSGEQFFGRAVEALHGVSLSELVAPSYAARTRELLAEMATSTRPTRALELPFDRPAGAQLIGEVVGLTTDIDGVPTVLTIIRDVTERRDLLVKLQLADRLASVGTLAAGVAHEINNPLTYVLANLTDARALMSQCDGGGACVSGDLQQLIAQSEEGAHRIRMIVSDLRSFSRASEATTSVDLREPLHHALNMARLEIRHRARIVEKLDDVPAVEAESGRLGQVFLNLLVNAGQAIPEGDQDGNEIVIRTYTTLSGNACVEISDTGGGIPEAIRERVFEPFVTGKPVGVGTGLGLSICHGIVRGFGGTIELEPRPAGGTTARVELPPAESAKAETAAPKPAVATSDGARILVVDDEPLVRRAVARILKTYQVTEAASGAEAIELLERGAFDAVVCDLMMPHVSGQEVYDRAAALGRADRFVFITGGACTAAADSFLAEAGAPVVGKPIDVGELRRTVEARLRVA